MTKKKVDSRVRKLLEAARATHTRALFVIVGDRARDQIVNLHYIMSKVTTGTRPTVLWCYKKDLGFSSHKQKRMKAIKMKQARGQLDAAEMEDDPFELFIASTKIRYTYYSESHKILGQTFGMCILQDFEALTPNLLARTIETVEGGGAIVLMLKSMTSLKQLYTMAMDVHSRYRTESYQNIVGRFNERFLLSLSGCSSALVLDDELNVLPLSAHQVITVPQPEDIPDASKELKELQQSLKDTQPIGALVSLARTLDQAKAVLSFVEAISEKSLRSTVSLTAGRGRGKSAAMGLALAGAIAYGYSNIFVTSPSPENLGTLFEFVVKALVALGFKEHLDFDVVMTTNAEWGGAIVRINVFHSHRQTIQYIAPQHHHKLSQAELVVIDEAAAIPLPLVKNLLGNYLVFMASTINGYEGTGRSLSLKLLDQLRSQTKATQTQGGGAAAASSTGGATSQSSGGRTLREVVLEEPIRYAAGDAIEAWMNKLLCLDATKNIPPLTQGLPHPSLCNLYYVCRDTLFSCHRASEAFLQQVMALYVSSHYKNSPNDLQLLADAPAHQLFVLLGPTSPDSTATPDVLCVMQVCFEGRIAKESVMLELARGKRPDGDLIPWVVSQQFQDNEFASLSGVRVVRVATHPDAQKMGYGTRCVQLLVDYFEGKFVQLQGGAAGDEEAPVLPQDDALGDVGGGDVLQEEHLKPRKRLPPLLEALNDRPAERVQYVGVSYGLTSDLYRFWQKNGFAPLYLRQTENETTGEHTCVMVRAVEDSTIEQGKAWLDTFVTDFRRRFANLLSYNFNKMHVALALAVLDPAVLRREDVRPPHEPLSVQEMNQLLTTFDQKRVESYARNLVDYHVILDLVPQLASLFVSNRIDFSLSFTQAALLVGMGLQRRSVDDMEQELNLEVRQILANFNKAVLRFSKMFQTLLHDEIDAALPPAPTPAKRISASEAEYAEYMGEVAEIPSIKKKLASGASIGLAVTRPVVEKKEKKNKRDGEGEGEKRKGGGGGGEKKKQQHQQPKKQRT